MRYVGRLGLALCLLAGPRSAQAATLAEALRQWSGVTADVIEDGPRVRIVLPPQSPVKEFMAHAEQTSRKGDPGWALDDVTLPLPLHGADAALVTIREQHASAWLGARTARADADYDGIAIDGPDGHVRLDHLHATTVADAGPVRLDLEAAGMHAPGSTPAMAALLPRHVVLHAHSTEDAVNALTQMFSGLPAAAAPLTLDALVFDIGPARFSGSGTVVFFGPHDRRGNLVLTATGFEDLLRQIPPEGPLLRLYPALMVMRSMAQKQGNALVWAVAFDGRRVLVSGFDIAAMAGL